MKRTRPDSTATSASAASGAILTYHCLVRYGSMTAPVRSPRGVISLCGSMRSTSPACGQFLDDALARLESIQTAQMRVAPAR